MAAAAVGAEPQIDLAAVAGVYKHRFRNGDVSGARFQGEDILEIVPLTTTTVYLKTHLDFLNGHTCGIHGVADVDGDALVMTDGSTNAVDPLGHRCVLTLRVLPTALRFEDPEQICKSLNCGVRGGFNGVEVARATRRPIRYLKLLKDSADFRTAVDEHRASHAELPLPP